MSLMLVTLDVTTRSFQSTNDDSSKECVPLLLFCPTPKQKWLEQFHFSSKEPWTKVSFLVHQNLGTEEIFCFFFVPRHNNGGWNSSTLVPRILEHVPKYGIFLRRNAREFSKRRLQNPAQRRRTLGP